MASAPTDVRFDRLRVVHAGTSEFGMGDRVRAVPLSAVLERVRPLSARRR